MPQNFLYDVSKLPSLCANTVRCSKKLRDAYTMMEKSSQKDDDNDEADAGFYSVVVFKSWDERLQFHEALGLTDNKFVDGKFLAGKLGNLSSEYAEE